MREGVRICQGKNNAVVRRANGGLCEPIQDQAGMVAREVYLVYKTSESFDTQWGDVLE